MANRLQFGDTVRALRHNLAMPTTTLPQRISADRSWPLWSTDSIRRLEATAAARLPAHCLMQRAGLSIARLTLALAPHADQIWVACGPGNNGGDGLEAAAQLQAMGKRPIVTWLGDEASCPADARAALVRARAAGVAFHTEPPANFDCAIDALLGLGATRAPSGRMATWLEHLNTADAPVLAVDLPTGLNPDNGVLHSSLHNQDAPIYRANNSYPIRIKRRFCLTFLGAKPGLFTAQGRDAFGEVWLDRLGFPEDNFGLAPDAWLLGADALAQSPRHHASHKGSYGDVAIVGGDNGMVGAALLAASAALHAGCGRVFVAPLGTQMPVVQPEQPELMFRHASDLPLAEMTVVCGCGGGMAVRAVLPRVLSQAARLVLDADALNAIAADASLQQLLVQRGHKGLATAMTPHPLEAARMLGISTAQLQAQRLLHAHTLAERFGCCVVLKGSGTVVAQAGQPTCINPTGNARLATAGTGDVLAGLVAGLWAGQALQSTVHSICCQAVFQHGLLADQWPMDKALTASGLARAVSPTISPS